MLWRSTATVSCVPSVIDYGNMLGCCRHEQTCTGDVIYKYPGGMYHTTQTVFDQLEDEGIDILEEDRYYPYRATYDIEVMLQPTDKRRSEKLEWTSQHVLLSVSVCSNVPVYKVPVCYISEGSWF